MNRRALVIATSLLALLILLTASVVTYSKRAETYPFRCSTFTRYDLSRKDDARREFAVTQDLRFINADSGYLLLNGQVTDGEKVTTLDRKINLSGGGKIDSDTYRYRIDKIVPSTTDNTPDSLFNLLLAELTLDPSYLQLDVTKVDHNAYLVGGPLSYLFTCQRY